MAKAGAPELVVMPSDQDLGRIVFAIGDAVAAVDVRDLLHVLREIQAVRLTGKPSGMAAPDRIRLEGVYR